MDLVVRKQSRTDSAQKVENRPVHGSSSFPNTEESSHQMSRQKFQEDQYDVNEVLVIIIKDSRLRPKSLTSDNPQKGLWCVLLTNRRIG